MPAVFLDSSAVAKRYHQESGSDQVNALFLAAKSTGEAVYASQVAVVEVQSVFAKKVRTGVISIEDSNVFRNRFLYDLRTRLIRVAKIQTVHYEEAARLVQDYGFKLNLRTLDAIQLAVALDLQHRGLIHTFVAADRALCGIAQQAGLAVLNPEQP